MTQETDGVRAGIGSLSDALNSAAFRHFILTALFISFFAWYIYPLAVVDYFVWTTKVFKLGPYEGMNTFSNAIRGDTLGLDEIPRLLVGVVGSGGLSLMLIERKQAPIASVFFSLLLVGLVLVAAFAAVATYHVLITYGGRLDEPLPGARDVFETIAVSRFRELWVLLAALAGLQFAVGRAKGDP